MQLGDNDRLQVTVQLLADQLTLKSWWYLEYYGGLAVILQRMLVTGKLFGGEIYGEPY